MKFQGKQQKAHEALHQAQEEAPEFEHVVWYKDPGLRILYWHCFILCVSSASTGYDGMFFNSVQNFPPWEERFDYPTGNRLGLLGASYQISSVVAIPFVPMITDRFGRRISIALGFIIMIIGAAVQAAAMDFGTFIGGRVLLGVGNPFAQIASPMLLTEIAHPQHRARLTTVYNCLWNAGAFIVAWTSFGTESIGNDWSWRIPALLQGVPSLIQLVFLFWIPESPRFLIAKDRHEEALQILAKYHANGDEQNKTVQFEYQEIRETIRLEQTANDSSSYLDFFRTPGNRYRFGILLALGFFSQWSGNAIVSNYSAKLYQGVGVDEALPRLGLSAGQTTFSTIVSITFALQVDRWGRRPIWLLATAGMLVSLILWTGCFAAYETHGRAGADIAVIFFIWLHGFFYSTAWSGLLVAYAIEILPYSLRAKGLMIMNLCVQASLAISNQANPAGFEHWEGETYNLYIIYVCWVAFELVIVYFYFIETKGPTLEEICKIIDGPDAKVAAIDLGKLDDHNDILVDEKRDPEQVNTAEVKHVV
ncbi:hypothetical protein NLU13_5648 [Sarocladium strictum]|uniref:Major facilitator superfamily (MFS) profile domain-containing protein n=1 Tax=Sarocladium strictum TaxID=5046 RepID=A0AA39L7Z9_SARSR|nr:hypothetical protein NLU13_5648 [Sarocladium strictum]